SPLDQLRNVANLQEVWTQEHTNSFNQLKIALASAPLIHPIDYTHPIHVATDASKTAISGVLYMQIGDEKKYVAMASRGLTSVERCYSTTRRELLAIVYCFQRFNKWLVMKHFTLHTDHRSLLYIQSQEIPNHLLLTYYETLFSLSYTVIHIPGILNVIADAGSRMFTEGYKLQGGEIINEENSGFIIRRDKRTLETALDESQTRVPIKQLNHFNISVVGFHPFRSTTPTQVFDHWSMDLATFNVTSTSGNNYMLILVDHFSRFTILRAITDKTSLTIAKELLNIFCLFSFPKVLTSDNGSEFVNEIVSQLILMSGIDRRLSLPYTPTGNSVTERFVGIAKSVIIKSLKGKHADWDLYLNPTQLAMNIKYSKLHKSRPYSIVFNRQPNDFKDYSNVTPTLSLMKADTKKIHDRLAFAQEVVIPQIAALIKNTQDNDHARFEKTHKVIKDMYPIGSKVMIINVHRKSKLEEKYSGPFTIKGYTKNKSYILVDRLDNLLSR
ncbi:hypothetical protein INT48_007210, partial [Thamnidium elegans]